MHGHGVMFRLETSLGLPAHHNPALPKKTRTTTALTVGSTSTGTRLSLPPIDDGPEHTSAGATGGTSTSSGAHFRPR